MSEHLNELEAVAELLPPVVVELVDLIGYRHVATLIERLGGISFPVSQNVRTVGNRRADVLADTLPADVVALVVQRFGGDVLYIPRCDAALRELRNRRFLAEYRSALAGGESGRFALMNLCPRFGFSDRYAQQVIANAQQQTDQLALL
ncbi:Mor transcription activator family protein [Salmonella enterica subsp. enterica serovar 3,10:z10:-]